MKKLFSMLTAVALACTCFSATAFAKTNNETIHVKAEKIDFSKDENSKYSDYNMDSDGFSSYLVTYYVTGFELQTTLGTTTMTKTKASGTSIGSWSLNSAVDVTKSGEEFTNYMIADVYPATDASAYTLNEFSDGVKSVTYGGAGAGMLYPSTGTALTVAQTDEIVLFQMVVVLDAEHSMKISLNSGKAMVGTYSNDKLVDGKDENIVCTVSEDEVALPLVDKVKVTGITASVEKTSFDLCTDKGEALKTTATATVTPDGATDKTVTWTSSDTDVATIDTNGNITVKAVGTTKIKATANDGSGVASDEVVITVEDSTLKYTEGVKFKGTDGKVHTWKATVGSTRTIIKITKKDVGTRNITDFGSFTLEDGAYRVFGIAIVTSADKNAFTFVIE